LRVLSAAAALERLQADLQATAICKRGEKKQLKTEWTGNKYQLLKQL
jgi:hypothetical protein